MDLGKSSKCPQAVSSSCSGEFAPQQHPSILPQPPGEPSFIPPSCTVMRGCLSSWRLASVFMLLPKILACRHGPGVHHPGDLQHVSTTDLLSQEAVQAAGTLRRNDWTAVPHVNMHLRSAAIQDTRVCKQFAEHKRQVFSLFVPGDQSAPARAIQVLFPVCQSKRCLRPGPFST